MIYPETITTRRLVLRRPVAGDAESIFREYASDPEVTTYLVWPPHTAIAQTHEFLAKVDEGWISGDELSWGLTVPPSDSVIGMIAIRPHGHRADIGYVLGRHHWNKGYMSEAGRALARIAFTDPNLFRLWALCDADNAGSARVLENMGMQREGVLRRNIVHMNVAPEPRDSPVYAMVRAADGTVAIPAEPR